MILKRTMNVRYRLFATLSFFLLIPLLTYGQSYSEKRIFARNIGVNSEMILELNNKYGAIHISPWEKDSLSVRVEVEAFASNQERLNKMFQGVDINISETSYMIRAQTDFTQNISMLFESFKGMTNKLIPYESRIQINYFVDAPEYLNMRIINKYGDVYMEDNTGTFSLTLSNGSFKARSLNKANGLDLTFCDAAINKINAGDIDASFSEVMIGESQDLTITSVSSRFNLNRAGKIYAESRRDKFFIGKAGSVRGNSYFTDFRIEELSEELNVETRYGSVNASLIDKNFEMLTINSGYTDINLVFDPLASFNLDIRHLNSFLVVPDKNSKIEKKTLSEEKKEYMTFGTVGRNPGSRKVIINATRGNIYLK